MATQSRGAPYPLGSDPNNTAADIQALSLWVNDRPGVSTFTTTERNALTGAELWDGRTIANTTTDRLNRYDLGSATWIVVPDNGDIGALLATTGTPADLGLTASRGVAAFAARSDHVHATPAWQAYTPTVQGGFNPGTTGLILEGRYVAIGKTIHFRARWKLGTGFTIGSAVGISLPVARAAGFDQVAHCMLTDSGAANHIAFGYMNSVYVSCWVWNSATNAIGPLGATTPFTWVAGDEIEVNGTYEAA